MTDGLSTLDLRFFPGRKPPRPEPLAVFLPPFEEGVGAEYLSRLGAAGKRVVDPFGQSPALALELARAGAAVLVASPNPVLRALIDLQADPPAPEAIRAVLAKLSKPAGPSSPESIEDQVRGLYKGTCALCGRESEAGGYVWEQETEPAVLTASLPAESRAGAEPKGRARRRKEGTEAFLEERPDRRPEPRLVARICECPFCRHVAEEPATPEDRELVRPYLVHGVRYHLALERFSPRGSANRAFALEALALYPPRTIYALFKILIHMETQELTRAEKRCFSLLMLAALDEAHILRGHGRHERVRPRSLVPPPEYCEINVWKALQRAATGWIPPAGPVPLQPWKPGSALEPGRIAVYAGSARDLAARLEPVCPNAAITFLPRPNQAYWTLSAMWAGWLWGEAAAAPLMTVLRHRHDWNWHARALTASAEALAAALPAQTPVAGFLGECEPEFLAAALWSFHQAGFALRGRALRDDTDAAQILWSAPGPAAAPPAGPAGYEPAMEVARLAARELVSWRSEPTSWNLLHAAAWSEMCFRRVIPILDRAKKETAYARGNLAVTEAVEKDPDLRSAARAEGEAGRTWWLAGDDLVASPLSDQVEQEAARLLLDKGPLAPETLDARICAFFPGLLTPEASLIRACLDSYGCPAEHGDTYTLRPEDLPASREVEIEIVRGALADLGGRLGFAVRGGEAVEWDAADGKPAYRFFPIVTAEIGRFLLQPAENPAISWIVLPGGRAPLVLFKLARNGRLREAVKRGWRFLKFRHIRKILSAGNLRAENLEQWLNMDPLGTTEDKVPFF